MGGLGSGRRKQHTRTDDCLTLDTAWLRKQKYLSGSKRQRFGIQWTKSTIIDFHQPKERQHNIGVQVVLYGDQGGEFTHWDASGQVNLFYQANTEPNEQRGAKQKQSYKLSLPLVTTSPNYGGVRWWFLAPCCGARVRVVYIPLQGELARLTPQCRNCLDLHYPSQMASYIERHKTYERYLLANYGLYWAANRYDHELKEHYLEMTPALWALRLKSVIDWNMHLLAEVIRCDLMIYRTDLANLKSLRSEEDRQIYLAHMQNKQRQLDTQNFIRTVYQCIEYERLKCALATGATRAEIDRIYERLAALRKENQSEQAPAGVEDVEQKIISLEARLKQVNKANREGKAA